MKTKMDKDKISKYRAEIIVQFINIEKVINAIISQHYFKKVLLPFYLEVLYDEYFTFALRRRILEKIIKNINKQRVGDLNRLNTIRNYFAHCDLEMFEASDTEKKYGKIVDPRATEKAIDFDRLYSEFIQKKRGVLEYLIGLYENLGGVLLKE